VISAKRHRIAQVSNTARLPVGFAVNAVLWGLGYKVVLGVADSLTEPDWTRQAMRMRQETIDLAHNAKRSTRVLAAVRDIERLLADDVPDTDMPRARHEG